MKKKFLLILMLLIPFNVYAYSDKIIVEGKPIGIEANSEGIYVVDLYKIDGKLPKNIKKGDLILEVNDKKISNISEFNNIVNDDGTYKLKIKREEKEIFVLLNVVYQNESIRTGIYVKDKINGIGTLSYVDPVTHVFGSLGHEILESSSMSKFNLKNGYIYEIYIDNINKNNSDRIGEFHGTFSNDLIGTLDSNELNGIYGVYTATIDMADLVDVSDIVRKGDAYLRIDLNGAGVKDYLVNILSIDENDSVKNIFFEIVDSELLNETGGIIQGMSGTPIIQDGKIVGVVNYVVVDDSKKGYGVFIKTMLEAGDKLLNN